MPSLSAQLQVVEAPAIKTTTENTSEPRGPRLSAKDKRQRNNYLREFIPAIITFWILLAVVQNTVDETTSGARLWILLPVVPMIGVSRQTINALEKGRYDPSLPLAFRLARVFSTTIEDLFSPSDEDLGITSDDLDPAADAEASRQRSET